ncbi:hypothetical protein C8J56DRAFT_1064761 [Mycena floridula]|nr:hypothetical protein C8J56DRAFT_1064761 [Mycena floridula]
MARMLAQVILSEEAYFTEFAECMLAIPRSTNIVLAEFRRLMQPDNFDAELLGRSIEISLALFSLLASGEQCLSRKLPLDSEFRLHLLQAIAESLVRHMNDIGPPFAMVAIKSGLLQGIDDTMELIRQPLTEVTERLDKMYEFLLYRLRILQAHPIVLRFQRRYYMRCASEISSHDNVGWKDFKECLESVVKWRGAYKRSYRTVCQNPAVVPLDQLWSAMRSYAEAACRPVTAHGIAKRATGGWDTGTPAQLHQVNQPRSKASFLTRSRIARHSFETASTLDKDWALHSFQLEYDSFIEAPDDYQRIKDARKDLPVVVIFDFHLHVPFIDVYSRKEFLQKPPRVTEGAEMDSWETAKAMVRTGDGDTLLYTLLPDTDGGFFPIYQWINGISEGKGEDGGTLGHETVE